MNKSAALITLAGRERGVASDQKCLGILPNMICIQPTSCLFEGSGASWLTWLTDVATLWHACAAF